MSADVRRRLVAACILVSVTAGVLELKMRHSWAQGVDQGACTYLGGKKPLRGDLGTLVTQDGMTILYIPKWTDQIHFNVADSGLHFSVGVDRVSSIFVSDKRFPTSASTCAGEKEITLTVSDGREFRGCVDKGRLTFRSNDIAFPLDLLDELFPVKVVCNELAPTVPEPTGAKVPSRRESPLNLTTAANEAQVAKTTIEKIRQGRHAPMPAAQVTPAVAGGGTSMLVGNDTQYNLTVYLSGPASRVVRVAPKSTQTVPLEAGHYEVAAKVSNPSVIPFYGVADYGPDTKYSEKFFIQTRIH